MTKALEVSTFFISSYSSVILYYSYPIAPSGSIVVSYFLFHFSLLVHFSSHRIASFTMNTSQELTRFLRGKGGSLHEKIALCNQLVQDQLDVYLPFKEVFVLELACDRLNDNKKEYTNWKLAPEVWDLLTHIVSKYPESSSRSLKRLRFVESIITIIEQGAPEIITNTLPVANFLLDHSIMTADANSTQLMLALVLNAVNTKKIVDSKVLSTITKIYHLPRRSARYKPAKKTTSQFFESCLVPLLRYLTSNQKDDNYDQLHQIFISGTFSKDSTLLLKENIGRLVKSLNLKDDNTDSIKYLFHYVVARSSKDIKLCEEIFLVLTENQKSLTNTLLETLSGANRVLSSSFFETLYSEHNQNHQLVGSLIDLDASLGVKHAAEIASSLTESDEILLGKLFNAFIRVRDYSSFFLDIWLSNADNGGVWQSPSVIDIVASKVPGLTLKSLLEVLNEVLKNHVQSLYSVLLISILKGLLNCDDSRRNAMREQIVNSNLPNSQDWKVRFYCSILYGDDGKIDSKADYNDIYFFYTRFRHIELGNTTDSCSTKFIELIKKLPKDEQEKHLFTVYRRWPKILARHFEPENLEELLDLFLEVDGHIEYFEKEAEVFFEEKRLNRLLVACLIKKLKKHPKENMFKLGTAIPSACFERHERRKIIENLVSSPNSEDNEQSLLELICHILDEPSFASNLETDISTLFSFIERFVGTLFESNSLQIFQKIWLAHTAQINDEKHWSYVSKVLETLLSSLNKKANLHGVLCKAIFSTETTTYKGKLLPLLQDLFSKLIKEILESLKRTPSSELLNTLKEVSIFDRGCIARTTLNKLASQISKELVTDALNLFCLLCNIEHERFEQALHVLAVYTTLVPMSNSGELDSALCAYGTSLVTKPDHFLATVKYVLYSFSQDPEPENRYIYLRALSCLSNSNEPGNDIIRPFVAILSADADSIVTCERNLKLSLQILAKQLASVRIGQYSFELVVAFVTKVSRSLLLNSFEDVDSIYKTLTQIASALLLFHRVRMSSRHHLITDMFCALMEPLTLLGNKHLAQSSMAVEYYTRVVSNLCEPKFKAQRTGSLTLNSASASAKRSLRKHLPVILLAFIHYSLNSRFGDKTLEELLACMSIVFDTISDSELQIVNASLDLPGKLYMKLIYTRYKENYKWKTT